jgi:hypothetical protein
MKRIDVTIPPAKLDEVKDALAELDIPGLTVREVKVFDRTRRRREVYRGTSYVVDFTNWRARRRGDRRTSHVLASVGDVGNFPQALSHVSLVNTAHNLALAQAGPARHPRSS